MTDVIELTGRKLRTRQECAGRGTASYRWRATDFEQLEPERLDLREHAVQRSAVGKRPGQQGVAATRLSLQGKEGGAYRLAQASADTDTEPVRLRIIVCTGHFLTAHEVNRPAGGCTVIGTCTVPLLLKRILTASLGAGKVSSQRTIYVISGQDQRPWQKEVSRPRARYAARCRERHTVPVLTAAPRSHTSCDDNSPPPA